MIVVVCLWYPVKTFGQVLCAPIVAFECVVFFIVILAGLCLGGPVRCFLLLWMMMFLCVLL